MKNLFIALLAIVFATSFFSVAIAQRDSLSPIQYQVLGDKKRADAVASYLARKGYSATPVVEPGVHGQLNGKKWPGVRVAQLGSGTAEGIFIPVSDAALKKGLCSDQQNLLDGLMKYHRPTSTERSVEAPTQAQVPCPPRTAIIPDCCTCGDIPWFAKGIWADFPIGAYGVEIQDKPREFVRKIKWVVREGNTIRAICCFKKSSVPGFDEMESKWGNGRPLILWKDFGGCDGGANCTTQILLFQ